MVGDLPFTRTKPVGSASAAMQRSSIHRPRAVSADARRPGSDRQSAQKNLLHGFDAMIVVILTRRPRAGPLQAHLACGKKMRLRISASYGRIGLSHRRSRNGVSQNPPNMQARRSGGFCMSGLLPSCPAPGAFRVQRPVSHGFGVVKAGNAPGARVIRPPRQSAG